jgi:ATP-dependent DNA helicase HFM1/MER3
VEVFDLGSQVLAEHGINSLETLLKQSPLRIETVRTIPGKFFLSPADYGIQLLNRRSPFGFEVLASAQELPKYLLSVTEVDLTPSPEGHKPVEVELLVECSLVMDQSSGGPSKPKKQQGRASNMTTVLTLTSDLDFIDFRRIPYVLGQLLLFVLISIA